VLCPGLAGLGKLAGEDIELRKVWSGRTEYGTDCHQSLRGGHRAMLRRGNFGRAVNWPKTVVAVGLPAGFHFHDLRHTGNQLAADAGATTRELMYRMGHGSMRAALIHQHATTDHDVGSRRPRGARRRGAGPEGFPVLIAREQHERGRPPFP
jgi:integrase